MKKDTENQVLAQYFADRARKLGSRNSEPFVTISRQAGAGGRTLANEIQRQLKENIYLDSHKGWKVFDKDICDIIAEQPDLTVPMYSLLTEEYHSEFAEFLKNILGGGPSDQYTIIKRIGEILHLLATMGRVVLIGRGAHGFTRDLAGGIHLRLVAPLDVRINRMAQVLDRDPGEARKLIDRQDRERAKMVYDFFGEDIDDPTVYSEVWDTQATSIQEIASVVVQMIEKRSAKMVGKKKSGVRSQ